MPAVNCGHSAMRKYFALAISGLLLVPSHSWAQLSPEDTGLTTTGEAVYGASTLTIGQWIGAYLITPALALIGVIFLVLMIYAGFLWMTARGAEKQVTQAKDLMIQAIIGVIIISAAYAVTTFIFNALA